MKYINKDVLEFNMENTPFPHIVLDNFINAEYINLLLDDMDKLTIDKSYYYGDQTIEKNKYAFKNNFGENLSSLFKELNSDEFINILENKIGIHDIVRNNIELEGAGIHKIFNNGFLCMHTDFEGYIDKQNGILDRRINLLLYMNPKWEEHYGGELCLYDRTYQTITKKILPILNRCVIFITPNNIHGHPTPLNIPNDICRQSITTYYYTKNTTGKNLDGNDIQPVKWYFDIK